MAKNIRNEEDVTFRHGDIPASLDELYKHAIKTTTDAKDWYWGAKSLQKRLSQWLRAGAIVATAVGGLVPVIAAVLDKAKDSWGWGYLALGIAGACVSMDKFFGFSSTWIRYVTTATALESDLARFRFDWYRLMAGVCDKVLTCLDALAFVERVQALANTVRVRIEDETAAWATEYRSSLAELEKRIEAQRKEQEPGGIEVEVTDAAAADVEVEVTLGSRAPQKTRGGMLTFSQVPPGQHQVDAVGKFQGAEHKASRLVAVAAGQIVRVSIKLKP